MDIFSLDCSPQRRLRFVVRLCPYGGRVEKMVLLKEFVVTALTEGTILPAALIEVVWDYYSLEKVRRFTIQMGVGIRLIENRASVPESEGVFEIKDSRSGKTLSYTNTIVTLPISINGIDTVAVVCTYSGGFIYYPDLLAHDDGDGQRVGVIHSLGLESAGFCNNGNSFQSAGDWVIDSGKLFELWRITGSSLRKYSIFDVNTRNRQFYSIPKDAARYCESLVDSKLTSVVVGKSIYWSRHSGLICLTPHSETIEIVRFPHTNPHPGRLPRYLHSVWNRKIQRIYFINRQPEPGFYLDLVTQQWGAMASSIDTTENSSLRILDGGIIVTSIGSRSECYNPDTDTWSTLGLIPRYHSRREEMD